MVSLSLLLGGVVPNGPEASRARLYWARGKRTLDGEDRSEMIEEEGKAANRWLRVGRHFGTLAAASNTINALQFIYRE